MNQRDIKLALKKQRLQIQSAALRERLALHAEGFAPTFTAADRVGAAGAWLRQHPQLPIAAAVALTVARPRRTLRWVRRAFFAWQALNRLRSWLESERT